MSYEKKCSTCKKVFKSEKDFLDGTTQWRVCSKGFLWFNCSCGSTIMVPKDKFPWYSPTLSMSEEAKSLFNKIAVLQELPHIPSAIMELQQLLRDPDVETSRLSQVVRLDPILAAEVLKVSGKLKKVRPSEKTEEKIEGLAYAITFIGRKELGNLVVAASIRAFKLKTKYFSQEKFWEHAFITASIAEVLSTELKLNVDKDMAFLAGCLCNIGKIVAAVCYPERTDKVYNHIQNAKTQCSWPKAEKEHDLYDHCVLGEIGAAFWGFPSFIGGAIKYHHNPQETKLSVEKDVKLCHLIALANQLAHWILLNPAHIDSEILKQESAYFKIKESELSKLADKLTKQLL